MKNEDRYFELVRQAGENVSKYIKKRVEKDGEDRWGEYEATWNTLLFHELILIGEKIKDYLSMENPADTEDKETKGKKFDVWIQDSKIGINYVSEVKLIEYRKRKRGFGFTKLNSKDGVYGDLLKINAYLKSEKNHDLKGISIAANVTKGVDVNDVILKVDNKLKKLLSNDLRLLICSNGKCAYVPANKK